MRVFVGTRCVISGLMLLAVASCQKPGPEGPTMFVRLATAETGISFENRLVDSDDFNIIEYLYYYNGGGVALGDVNNDGLCDIYFSSNQGENRLYLNQGNFRFEDITDAAGASGTGNWKTGVTMADVNGDGWLDIFICGVGNYKQFNGRNQLLINNGDLTFTDLTEQYGLSFQGFSTQASFFDYDNDGDLDMYLVNHAVHTTRSYGDATLRFESDSLAGDILYQNDLIPGGTPVFTDVTKEAGILNSHIGYGLGIGVSDLDEDGDLDIYISNDFNENDYLYINQGDGTFKQELEETMPHSSRFSMGNDIADVNNDGLADILTLDMLPRKEEVIKTTAGEDPYEIYAFKLRYGYHYQVSRNALQLNQGIDSLGGVSFTDIAPLAGVEATDWSWAPLLADFDNDGYRDLFVANGIIGRPNDLDYINFISSDSAQQYYSDHQLVEQMPAGKVENLFFRNRGDRTFEDVTNQWVLSTPSYSNGAAYADLDNDGDLDLVVNNLNEPAGIYRNDMPAGSANFLSIRLDGQSPNSFGVGARVAAYAGSQVWTAELIPTRGWLSSVEPRIHLGLGETKRIDSVRVCWPNGSSQLLDSLEVNREISLHQADARLPRKTTSGRRFTLLRPAARASYQHVEDEFVAFNVERLIPHMLSTQGPLLSIGDVNGDGLDDFYVGGAAGSPGALFLQTRSGGFVHSNQPSLALDSSAEDVGSAIFDANGDGALDLLVVGGGQRFKPESPELVPRLYINNGRGIFTKQSTALPGVHVDASCVRAADFDQDGDMDVFIGGRVVPGSYGLDPPSYLLINNGHGIFVDETTKRIKSSVQDPHSLGMVSDAQWADMNGDGRIDLVVVGEWMPVTILIQSPSGMFEDATETYGLSRTNGWWNTVSVADMDGDGDVDLVAGNLGMNSRLRATATEPVSLYVGDIDDNNSLDQILTYFNQGHSYPLISRDQLVKQVPSLRRKFLKYANYAKVTLEDIIGGDYEGRFVRKDAYLFSTVYLQNNGENTAVTIRPLPSDIQLFPVYAICIDDVNNDGFLDILAAGNLEATQPEFGRYDAGHGLLLLGNGDGRFEVVNSQSSGFRVTGQGRDIQKLRSAAGRVYYLTTRNNDSLLMFER